ncbi:accessory gland protein Acp76A isoform X1 [Drosophila santomea]|uniref:accessory gland protein Acp76A isoform X1 n=1 Tax=Drosophila santomea TaxID=129105 RepID=UPI0019530BB8|nr:accessory gland protein Acp76A isoform X1 [Drosophila santomea]
MVKRILICFLLFLVNHLHASDFEINLIKQLSRGRLSRNFVFSPFAVHQALALLYLSKDNIKDHQLEKALGLNGLHQEEILSFFGEAREKAVKEKFTLANRIYFSGDYNASQNITQISENLGVEVKNMTFSGGHSSTEEIKNWLNKSINKAGFNLFGKKDISNSTRVVAVQGMSYSCVWKHREKAMTNRLFSYIRPNRKPFVYKVEMIYIEAPMEFFNEDQVRGVMVPFSNTDIGMLVLLPRPRYSTQQILQNLDKILNIKLREAEKTHLFLPKFKVHETLDLNSALKALGIKRLFTNGDIKSKSNAASFKQYNSLDVDQNRVLMTIDVGSDFDDRVLYVNRGFVFVIKDQTTIYMVGRMESI